MILGDSLQVMASLAEREKLRGKVQMVYIDPPYGIKFGSNWQVVGSEPRRQGRQARGCRREAEQIKAFRDTWELGIHSYLSYLRDRLVAARELLTESRIMLRPDRRRERASRSIADGRGLRQRQLRQPDHLRRRPARTTSTFLARCIDYIVWYAKDRERAEVSRRSIAKRARSRTGPVRLVSRLPDGTTGDD